MDVAARLEALEEEAERLREHVARLEGVLGLDFLPCLAWSLTPHEARLLGALLARDVLTKDAAMAVLYRDFGKDEPELKIVDVYVCKVRAKLKPFGVEICTLWGRGYYMTGPAKTEALRQVDDDRTVRAA